MQSQVSGLVRAATQQGQKHLGGFLLRERGRGREGVEGKKGGEIVVGGRGREGVEGERKGVEGGKGVGKGEEVWKGGKEEEEEQRWERRDEMGEEG